MEASLSNAACLDPSGLSKPASRISSASAGFEIAVKGANPGTVMASYDRVGGTYATEHDPLLNDILKGEWGWDGYRIDDAARRKP